jgi:hypothetical protein
VFLQQRNMLCLLRFVALLQQHNIWCVSVRRSQNRLLFPPARSIFYSAMDRLIGKIMGGNPVFRGTRVPVHMLAELVASRAHALTDGKCVGQNSGWPARAVAAGRFGTFDFL